MLPSSVLCRAQEAIQRQAARTAPLANVRLIAETAASAWAHEALAADRREARQARVMAINLGQGQAAAQPLDRDLSENPDRGAASSQRVRRAKAAA